LIVDAEEGITDQDVKIAGLALERGSAVIICVNKWDTVAKDDSTVGTYVLDIKDKLKFLEFAPIVFISALTGQRVRKILDIIEGVYDQYTKRISTAELNQKAREFIAAHPPPRQNNRDNSISYLTQVGVKPPTFIFFVKSPKGIHFSYERYRMNQMRSTFGFDQVPVRIFFKKKS
jgi:GTP-binding protein